ncbi:deoxyribonuclease IV [Candidatus Ruminimicrobiellum ovillum]|uniref:deoxyribonuclease IV n=1 Tax=Candidatus Ruminimicrobiellum ovillum TaxID=1947927 RepID=UPI00355A180F
MLNIGCHLSASDGYVAMAKQAIEIGANTFQFFTRNPRGFKAKDIDEQDIKEFLEIIKAHKFVKILAHAPYTLNPCSADKRVRELAKEIFIDDLKRMEYTPNNMYNFHPGSHVGQGIDAGIKIIADTLNEVLTKKQTTTVLLETMSGKGSEVGSKFEELKQIIDLVELKDKVGVCLDTCHIYDGGYDIVNDLDNVIKQFDSIIGLEKLKAIHLNDTKNPFASHKDRHEKIGEGHLGLDAISKVINHPKLKNLPFYLETPNEIDGYAKEIKILKEAYK